MVAIVSAIGRAGHDQGVLVADVSSVPESSTMMCGLLIARIMVSNPPTTVSAGIAITNQTQGFRNHGSSATALSGYLSVFISRPAEAVFLRYGDTATVRALNGKYNDMSTR